jgi:hypothetical protein
MAALAPLGAGRRAGAPERECVCGMPAAARQRSAMPKLNSQRHAPGSRRWLARRDRAALQAPWRTRAVRSQASAALCLPGTPRPSRGFRLGSGFGADGSPRRLRRPAEPRGAALPTMTAETLTLHHLSTVELKQVRAPRDAPRGSNARSQPLHAPLPASRGGPDTCRPEAPCQPGARAAPRPHWGRLTAAP